MAREATEFHLHGVVGIKHCINNKGRVLTLICLVSCVDHKNIIHETEQHELRNSSREVKSADDSLFRWILVSGTELCNDQTVEEDVCNWIKRASSKEGNFVSFM